MTTKTTEQKAAEAAAKKEEQERKAAEAQAKKDKAAADKAAKAAGHPVADLPKGKNTQDDEPPASGPLPLARTGLAAAPEEEPKEDTIRRNRDKARWEFGNPHGTELADMIAEQREITNSQK